MLKEEVLPQLVLDKKSDFRLAHSSFETPLGRYATFLKKHLERQGNLSNYRATEIINDDGLMVSSLLDNPNFKVARIDLIEFLTENPARLSQIDLVHAVMPFDEAYRLIKLLAKIPVLTDAHTKVILGTFDNGKGFEHKQNIRVLDGLIRELDFYRYKCNINSGTTIQIVESTYQKNLRKRH